MEALKRILNVILIPGSESHYDEAIKIHPKMMFVLIRIRHFIMSLFLSSVVIALLWLIIMLFEN